MPGWRGEIVQVLEQSAVGVVDGSIPIDPGQTVDGRRVGAFHELLEGLLALASHGEVHEGGGQQVLGQDRGVRAPQDDGCVGEARLAGPGHVQRVGHHGGHGGDAHDVRLEAEDGEIGLGR